MGFFGGGDIVKHDYNYVISVFEKIKNKNKLKTKIGTGIVECSEDFEPILKKMKEGKCSDKEIISFLKGDKSYKNMFFMTKKPDLAIRWTEIDKSSFTFSGKSNALDTKYKELGSLFIIEKAIKGDKYPDISEIENYYPDIASKPDWSITYKAQYTRIKKEFKGLKFVEYVRDKSFMDFITGAIKKFEITKKDTWNPADVWLLSKKFSKTNDLAKEINNCETLEQLNTLMQSKFIKNEVVGISLKKTKSEAFYDLINVNIKATQVKKIEDISVTEIIIPLAFADKDFKTKSTIVKVANGTEFSIRTNQSGWKHNIIYEPKQKGSLAQFGKVPIQMLKVYNKKILGNENTPGWKDIPNTLDKLDRKYWVNIFDTLNASNIIKLKDCNNSDLFIERIGKSLLTNNNKNIDKLSSLLQSMLFYYNIIIKIKKKEKIDEYFNSLSYLAQKKGPQFGPFGKLY